MAPAFRSLNDNGIRSIRFCMYGVFQGPHCREIDNSVGLCPLNDSLWIPFAVTGYGHLFVDDNV